MKQSLIWTSKLSLECCLNGLTAAEIDDEIGLSPIVQDDLNES